MMGHQIGGKILVKRLWPQPWLQHPGSWDGDSAAAAQWLCSHSNPIGTGGAPAMMTVSGR